MSTARVRAESPRKGASLRILIIEGSPSCRLTIAPADTSGHLIDRVEVIEATRAELEQHTSDSCDLVITHVHEARSDDICPVLPSAKEDLFAGAPRLRAHTEKSESSSSSVTSVRMGIFRKLFGRRKLRRVEREEQRVTRTIVFAEIQREIGIALNAIEMGDFDGIGEIALRLKNDGASYNFPKLSGLGNALYDTVPNRDIGTARSIAQKLMTYMGRTIGGYAS